MASSQTLTPQTLTPQTLTPRALEILDRLVAFALTPGYETYRGLGWYGVIECDLTRRAE